MSENFILEIKLHVSLVPMKGVSDLTDYPPWLCETKYGESDIPTLGDTKQTYSQKFQNLFFPHWNTFSLNLE